MAQPLCPSRRCQRSHQPQCIRPRPLGGLALAGICAGRSPAPGNVRFDGSGNAVCRLCQRAPAVARAPASGLARYRPGCLPAAISLPPRRHQQRSAGDHARCPFPLAIAGHMAGRTVRQAPSLAGVDDWPGDSQQDGRVASAHLFLRIAHLPGVAAAASTARERQSFALTYCAGAATLRLAAMAELDLVRRHYCRQPVRSPRRRRP